MSADQSFLPTGEDLQKNIERRHLIGRIWQNFFMLAIIIALIALTMLMYNIVREAFGVVAVNYLVNPDALTETYLTVDQNFDVLTPDGKRLIVTKFYEGREAELRIAAAEALLGVSRDDPEALRQTLATPWGELLQAGTYPEDLAEQPFGLVGQLPPAEDYVEVLYNQLGDEAFTEFAHVNIDDHRITTEVGEIRDPSLNDLANEYLGRLPAPPTAFEDMTTDQLADTMASAFEGDKNRLRILAIQELLSVRRQDGNWVDVARTPIKDLFDQGSYPPELRDKTIGDPPLEPEEYAELFVMNLSEAQLRSFVLAEVAGQQVVGSWPMNDVILDYGGIEERLEQAEADLAEAQALIAKVEAGDATEEEELEAERQAELIESGAYDLAGSQLEFRSWVNLDFFTHPMSSKPEFAGIRTALLGTIWMISMTILFAFPLGIGAAIYLEEYAQDNMFNRIIQTNIYNLSGVPSIIYGILGLAVFVRALETLTSGTLFGLSDPTTANGRTLISASLTMSLLILPIIIINAQEAIRSVPSSIRQASYGLGATQWQTIWNHVLPYSLPGILTGTILAVSRAIGETAPMIVVGAAAYITANPDSPFAKFTVLPIQIYRWTAEPEPEFRDAAAAAIVVLLAMLLTLNSVAILLRNRFSRR